MQKQAAKIISYVFHPFLMPTMGCALLLFSGVYYSGVAAEIRYFILLVVSLSTAILPMLTVAVLSFNPKFDIAMQTTRDRIIPLFLTAVFYYIGFLLLAKVNFMLLPRMFLGASVLLLVALLFITFRWKISIHMASIGAITATIFALSFRAGMNPLFAVVGVVIISGLVGTARLILQRHNLFQLTAGYLLGFLILYGIIYFV
ncbi:MAG: hypothetical protein CSA36_02815 [Draconibacterium sp.]|nr:MAG: hypothetical protein CSA36_02815 [Draconibacterium sp.]